VASRPCFVPFDEKWLCIIVLKCVINDGGGDGAGAGDGDGDNAVMYTGSSGCAIWRPVIRMAVCLE